ncbi:uncharacterized protein C9orf152-like [Heptranchias perlo]|uniref:uncharacterized protein C9orf152-like n=1 Tax=Heptranchias perlo TaxID=212740 RepID=UPI00355A908B
MFLSSCCPKLNCVWEQMVRAKVYVTQVIDRGNHIAGKYWKRNSVEDNSVLMDINELEEQYDSIRQKQKEQTHIVFRTGERNRTNGEFFNLQVKTVSVNCTVRKPKAFEERLPVNGVTLDFPNKECTQDSGTPWRTHLDIHRLVQAQSTSQKNHVQENKTSDDQNHQLGSMSKNVPFHKGVVESRNYEIANSEATTDIACKPNELGQTIHSFNNHNHYIPRINKRFSFPNERSNIWASKNGLVTRIVPVTTKMDYYPFPQMKTPKKSDAAKSLGLYAKC